MSDENEQYDAKIIGGKLYTRQQIEEIEREYGEGFLERNPHFPAAGIYNYGNNTGGPLLTLAEQKSIMIGLPYPYTEKSSFLDAEARQAYERYAAVTDWKNFQGNPMPQWGDLPEKIRAAWVAAVEPLVIAGLMKGVW